MSAKPLNLASNLFELGRIVEIESEKEHDYKSIAKRADIKRLLQKVLPVLEDYELSVVQILLIADFWRNTLTQPDYDRPMHQLVQSIFRDERRHFDTSEILRDLVEKGVLSIGERTMRLNMRMRRVKSLMAATDSSEYEILSGKRLKISRVFFESVMSLDKGIARTLPQAFASNDEYLGELFRYVQVVKEAPGQYIGSLDPDDRANIERLREEIRDREEHTHIKFPIQEVRDEFDLDESEFLIIVYLLFCFIGCQGADTDDLHYIISESPVHRMKNERYFQKDSKLLKKELIEMRDSVGMFRGSSKSIALSPYLVRRLLHHDLETDADKLAALVRDESTFTIEVPKHGMDAVILNDELRALLLTAVQRYGTNVQATLEQWGLYSSRRSPSKKQLPRLIMLFHGEPGTGKTHSAYALAHSLGKSVLKTDISEILGRYVGESEQNLRSIFTTYSTIVDSVENPPILLLNECDQFLGSRMQAKHPVDKMYNQMQDILLENLETFQGTCIMTTNVVDFLDKAFSRRIDIKVKFERPDTKEREALWRLHLLPTIPGVDTINTQELAEKYQLSGGQITVVVENAATEVAARNLDSRMLCQQDLVKYIELELTGQFEGTGKGRIGF